jgi:hypothetical protein
MPGSMRRLPALEDDADATASRSVASVLLDRARGDRELERNLMRFCAPPFAAALRLLCACTSDGRDAMPAVFRR